VAELVKRGHRVFVQSGAGLGASYCDEQYKAFGAEIVADAAAVFAQAELIVKVKEPQRSEVAMLKPHHILFTYLHLAADKALTESLMATGCTAIAYETIEVNRRLPAAGADERNRRTDVRHRRLLPPRETPRRPRLPARRRARRGPGRVVVLGGGTAGVNAARVATGIGADVTILEVDFERMRFLDITMSGTSTVYSNEANLAELLPRVDLVIGAVLVPGAAHRS
jgi:alanine dehydrogenase